MSFDGLSPFDKNKKKKKYQIEHILQTSEKSLFVRRFTFGRNIYTYTHEHRMRAATVAVE